MKITMVFIAFAAAIAVISAASPKHPFMDVMKIRAVIGRDAIIPCGQKKIFLDGPEAYVSWMKNDKEMIYRFPLNNSNQDGYSSSNELCYKSSETGPCRERTSLFLPRVSDADSAQYRCRIHYQGSPSIDYSFQLIIVDKPGFPTVYDEDGNTMTNTFIGPIPLGANVTLICEVKDARPNTVVYWEKQGDLFVPSTQISSTLKRSVLRIINATRDQHETRYACIAQAGDVTDPLKNTFEIRMYLPPLSIKINLNERHEFEADNPRVVDCIVSGSVPAPTIQWFLDETPLNIYSHKESPGFNVTLSSMTFTPKRSDDNRILSCRATNHYFKETFSNSVRLTVGYKPVCAQTLKQKLNIRSDKIEKVICFVDAVPPPLVVTWNFSDYQSVETPIEATDIPFRYKSVLSWIPHNEDIGNLGCRAINSHGKQDEPCLFDLHNKVHVDCPSGQQSSCINGGILGPPHLTGKTFGNKGFDGLKDDKPSEGTHSDVIVIVVVVIVVVVIFIFSCTCYLIVHQFCKNKNTSQNNCDNIVEKDPTTYYRGSVGLEDQIYPEYSSTVIETVTNIPSTGSTSPEEPGIKRYASPVFTKCDIHTFYV